MVISEDVTGNMERPYSERHKDCAISGDFDIIIINSVNFLKTLGYGIYFKV